MPAIIGIPTQGQEDVCIIIVGSAKWESIMFIWYFIGLLLLWSAWCECCSMSKQTQGQPQWCLAVFYQRSLPCFLWWKPWSVSVSASNLIDLTPTSSLNINAVALVAGSPAASNHRKCFAGLKALKRLSFKESVSNSCILWVSNLLRPQYVNQAAQSGVPTPRLRTALCQRLAHNSHQEDVRTPAESPG